MAWGGFILTNAGRNLLAKVQAGTIAGLNITRFGIGDGTYAGSYSTITNLVSQKQSVPLRTKKAKDQFTNIDGYFSNEGLLTGFYFKEWGIFAMDGLQEILYAYDNAGDDAEYIAPDGNVRYEKMLKAALSISANIAVTINTSGVIYATTDDIVSNIELHDSNEEAHPDIRQKLGDITTLTTVDKTSAVAAINELRELNNILVADYIRSPGYGVTTGSANTYILTLNPALTAYVAGVCVAVKINVANTGASTINVNGLGAKPIKDSKGNFLTSGKLALNSVYTFRYDGSNFILQGEGGEYGTATASDVLSGKTIGTDSGLVTGTIPSKAAATITPSTIAQTIAAGQYLSGIQTILGDADLVSANIKAGANIFGVAGNANVVDTSAGNAVAADILATKVAFVDGAQISGSMVNRGAATLTPGASAVAIPVGYHNGSGIVSVVSNLVAGNIKSGVSVGGVVGTFLGLFLFTAGDNILLESAAEVINNSTTPTKLKEALIGYSGTYRITFTYAPKNYGYNGYAQIYKNGVAYGSSVSSNADALNYSADIVINAGDLVQVYGWGNGSYGVKVSNFRVKCDLSSVGTIIK